MIDFTPKITVLGLRSAPPKHFLPTIDKKQDVYGFTF